MNVEANQLVGSFGIRSVLGILVILAVICLLCLVFAVAGFVGAMIPATFSHGLAAWRTRQVQMVTVVTIGVGWVFAILGLWFDNYFADSWVIDVPLTVWGAAGALLCGLLGSSVWSWRVRGSGPE